MAPRPVTATLEALATQYERDAAAIRVTLSILNRAQESRTEASAPAPRKMGRPKKAIVAKPAPKAPHNTKAAKQRARTRQFLDMFHGERASTPDTIRERLVAKGLTPRAASKQMRSIGALVRREYLAKVGPSQYTRTARPFDLNGASASA